MGYRRTTLAVGEWFHCYTRTIDHSRPFKDSRNPYIDRFLETLYLANQASAVPIVSELRKRHSHEEIFSLNRGDPLVSIAAYSIMPTHYHLLVQPVRENGLSEFMHKAGTGFTTFYNKKNGRVGNLFVKPFRSKHVSTDEYIGRVISYIHLNAAELFEPEFKRGHVRDKKHLEEQLCLYEPSSLMEYRGMRRARSAILDREALGYFEGYQIPLEDCIAEAFDYYLFLELGM